MDRRALTDEQKVEVIVRLLGAWVKSPFNHERLGQFIFNTIDDELDTDLFYTEDYDLVEAAELRVRDADA